MDGIIMLSVRIILLLYTLEIKRRHIRTEFAKIGPFK
jgi:hypothetical protein